MAFSEGKLSCEYDTGLIESNQSSLFDKACTTSVGTRNPPLFTQIPSLI